MGMGMAFLAFAAFAAVLVGVAGLAQWRRTNRLLSEVVCALKKGNSGDASAQAAQIHEVSADLELTADELSKAVEDVGK